MAHEDIKKAKQFKNKRKNRLNIKVETDSLGATLTSYYDGKDRVEVNYPFK
jgi:hypothetical protein